MLDAELQLAVDACGVSVDGRAIEAPPPGIRWERFSALAGRHRVQALCWRGLKPFAGEIPENVATQLRSQARAIVVSNLAAVAESARLYQAFQDEGVSLLFLKGLTLGALAYRDPFLKMSVDIDLLVEPGNLICAAHLLRAAGYVCEFPQGADHARLADWHARRKESVWRKEGSDHQIDLHTRLADHPAILSSLNTGSPSQMVPVSETIALPTLANDELFAYLCVHGASSAWFRLKWVADLAAFLSSKTAEEIARFHDRAQSLGTGRAAAQALLLVERIFSIGVVPGLRRQIADDLMSRWLVAVAARQLSNPVEPTERFLGTASIHWSQLGLRPGLRFKLSEAARQLRDALDRVAA